MSGHYVFGKLFKKEVKMDFTIIVLADMNSPRQDLSSRGLGIVVALLVRWHINSSWAYS